MDLRWIVVKSKLLSRDYVAWDTSSEDWN